MIFDLTDEDRAALEKLRAQRGHRSQAETLRALIRDAGPKVAKPERKITIRPCALPASKPGAAHGSRLKKR